MKKMRLLGLTLIAMMLAVGCQKKESVEVGNPNENLTILDLTDQNQTYAKAYNILLNNENVLLITENHQTTLNGLKKDVNSTSEDGEFMTSENDSVSIMISNESISIVSSCTEDEEKFLIQQDVAALESYYNTYLDEVEAFNVTKSTDEVAAKVTMLNPAIMSFKSGVINTSPNDAPSVSAEMAKYETAVTNTVDTKGVYPDRKMDRIRIWLLRQKGYIGLSHEIRWAQQDALEMFKGIKSDIKVDFYTRNTEFKAGWHADETLDRFDVWLRTQTNAGHDWSGSVEKDIFMLITWGMYSKAVVGYAWYNQYDKSRTNNPWATGVSSISPMLAPSTLAHEICHIIGGDHNSYTWKDAWWKPRYKDLLNTNIWHTFMRTSTQTKESSNVKRIYNNIK